MSKDIFSKTIKEDLGKSGLTSEDGVKLGFVEINGDMVIPYKNGSGLCRIRHSHPRKVGNKEIRYSQPKGSAPELYLPQIGNIDWVRIKRDVNVPLLITEGEKKAASACKVGIPTIGLGGVSCWSQNRRPIAQWDEFNFKDREVSIVFDSDIIDKAPVQNAERRLANMLAQRGAIVRRVRLSAEGNKKVGLDDFLVDRGLSKGDLKAAKAAFEDLSKEVIPSLPRVDELVSELNEKFSIVNVNGQTLIQEEINIPQGPIETMYLRLADFNLRMRNRYAVDVGGDLVNASVAWLNHPNRREYSRVVFEPSGCKDDEYNLWQGLCFISKKGDCSLLLQHIFEVICNGDEVSFRYLEAWCADIVKNPANRPGVAVVMRGEEGVGKGIFAQALMKLTSPHSVQVTQGHQVIGRFNSILKGRVLVFLDEAFWAGDKQSEGALKGMITERELVIEYKGKEPIRLTNYSRILMASNNEWVVPAGHGARRFFVLDVGSQYKGDQAYFNRLVSHIDDGGLQAWADHLLNLDTSKIELRSPPKTKALLDQKLESMDSVDRFIYDMLMEGVNNSATWNSTVAIDRLYQDYLDSANKTGERWHSDKNKFGKRLTKIFGLKRERPMINLIRQYVWCFPPLQECRDLFARYMEADIEWQEVHKSVPRPNPHRNDRY